MANSEPPPEVAQPVRWGFAVGALAGFVLAVPATALAVYLLARLGLGNPDRSLGDALRFATLFAGLPAILSAGGTARIALRAAAERGGTASAVRAGAATFAAAGVGLVLLCAIPLGGLPDRALPFLGFAAAGVASGAPVGALIGLWAGHAVTLASADDALD